ncbi:Caffeoyl-CoA O-methyltransferase 2 [Toxocara canis]|uniref:Caffeoyl-CoA O-methyltransferase 2 n=1 Tax=Toxocara canis TaxID=6265 RepID=A0A0B2VDT8_TOXCA|nr:Caffeoyl-CoA O-methyltransferase 2 [Toxocara canis]
MPTISKSYNTNDPIIKYCANVSLKPDPLQVQLAENTIKNAPMHGMLGAPEVLQFGQNLIRLTRARRALDIGTYTGGSALAWALALPPDGEVISMDIDHTNLSRYGKHIIDSKPDVARKISFKLGPAINTLDSLIAAGQNGTWDFAFIDADKENYPNYYTKCVQLLRPGGVILIDNALRGGTVVLEEKDESTKAIDATNHMIANDTRVDNTLLNLGDGTHVVFKKYE